MKAVAKIVATTLGILLGLSGCAQPPATSGAAQLIVSLHDDAAAVTRVRVVVTGTNIVPAITSELTQSGGQWTGTVADIPVGTGRTFRVEAFDAASVKLFEGVANNITVTSSTTVVVAIVAQQVDAHPPFGNNAPRISALTAESATVTPNGTLNVSADAVDADGDTLTYQWTATAGTFSTPTATTTSWTAPVAEGAVTLTFTATDSKGAASSASFVVTVAGTLGSAQVDVSFNRWPTITALVGSPNNPAQGGFTDLTAVIEDDGDALAYAWSAGCAGTFSSATAASPRFTLDPSVTGPCTLSLTVTDARGGSHSGWVGLQVGTTAVVNYGPTVTSATQSSFSVTPGETITLSASATDPEGGAVQIFFFANSGTIESETAIGPGEASAVWRAPLCSSNAGSATAVVYAVDPQGVYTSRTFTVDGLPACAATPAKLELVVGATGGTLQLADGARLVIPAGALPYDTLITLEQTGASAPSGFGAVSTIYQLRPTALVLARPADLSLPAATGSLYWSRPVGSGYDSVGGSAASGLVTSGIVHFGSGFVGATVPVRSVRGSSVVLYSHSVSGRSHGPRDLTSVPIAAEVWNGSAYDVYPGVGYANGTFTIPGVPHGSYLLVLSKTRYQVSASAIDLGSNVTGRADGVPLTFTLPSYLNYDLTDLLPWSGNDWLRLNAQDNAMYMQLYLDGPAELETQVAGTAEISGSELTEWSLAGGDTAYIAQHRYQQLGNADTWAIERIASFGADLSTGGTASVTRGLATPAFATIAFDFRGADFEAYAPQMAPAAVPAGAEASVYGVRHGETDGTATWTSDFLVVAPVAPITNEILGPFTYGVPFSWAEEINGLAYFQSSVQIPGTVAPLSLFTYLTSYDIRRGSQQTVQPVVGPVANPTIDGVGLFSTQTISSTPLVSWSPPAVGSNLRYTVRIDRIIVDASNRTRRDTAAVAAFDVTGTSIRIPAGLLLPGNHYVFRISADSSTYPDRARSPNRPGYPFGHSEIVSALLQVP